MVEYFQENSPVTPSTDDRAVLALALERLAGADRYGTAAAVAVETFGTADEVLLANGSASADALAGNYLAGVRSAPVLLTARDSVPAVTLGALEALEATKVTVLGGVDVVSAAVVAQLEAAGLTVQRLQGADRYATAAAIAQAGPAADIGVVEGKGRTAVLANGLRPVDALVAGAPAFAANLPVLLTTGDDLSSAASTALEALDIEHVLLVGGPAVLSDAVVADLTAHGIEVERLFGVDRRATAVAVADYARATFDFVDTSLVLARGDVEADALAGGPLAGSTLSPILLTASPAVLGNAVTAYVDARCGTLSGYALGGPAAISQGVLQAVAAASICD